MGFTLISIDQWVKMYLKNNPSEKEQELRKRLKAALAADKKGVKCSCGNDLWIIGSAIAGNACFTCITGEAYPANDYEVKRNS